MRGCDVDEFSDFVPRVRFPEVWRSVRDFTSTDSLRIDAVYDTVLQLEALQISGDLVECGVWRGGSSMAMALALNAVECRDRTIWMYDTFEGMTLPEIDDVALGSGESAMEWFVAAALSDSSSTPLAASVDEVIANIQSTGFSPEKVRFVVGPVEETLSLGDLPEQIALLRLDTDWYASTRAELETLYPRMTTGGVLIVDDYWSWSGSKKAVDDYFLEHNVRLPLIHVGGGSVMTVVP